MMARIRKTRNPDGGPIPKGPTRAELIAHERAIEEKIMADGGGEADMAGMQAYYRQLVAEGYDPVPPEFRRSRK